MWVGVGLAIGVGTVVGTQYSVHGLTPPSPIPGRMDTSRRLHMGDISMYMWVGVGLAIEARGSNGNMLHAAECQPLPPLPPKPIELLQADACTLARWEYSHVGGGGASDYRGGDSSGDTLQCA